MTSAGRFARFRQPQGRRSEADGLSRHRPQKKDLAVRLATFTSLLLVPATLACGSTSGDGDVDDNNPGGGTAGSGGGGGINDNGEGGGASSDGCNTANFDIPGNNKDEDCNGTNDDEPFDCDASIDDIADNDAGKAAEAIGLCRRAQGGSWGVITAEYVKADGSSGMADQSHGLLKDFGEVVKPREGARLLALSTGHARDENDEDFSTPKHLFQPANDMNTFSATPLGFPKGSLSCPATGAGKKEALDPAGLEVRLRVPANANSFSFDFNFYTAEFPGFICQEWNDFFVTLMDPPPPSASDGNISFDTDGSHISVNSAFLDVCSAKYAGGKKFDCGEGSAGLRGTGYDGNPDEFELDEKLKQNAATGWLTTTAPVTPGSDITLRFTVWDQEDANLNTTVLIDNFRWDVDEVEAPTTIPR